MASRYFAVLAWWTAFLSAIVSSLGFLSTLLLHVPSRPHLAPYMQLMELSKAFILVKHVDADAPKHSPNSTLAI
jgi:hypothetical protein